MSFSLWRTQPSPSALGDLQDDHASAEWLDAASPNHQSPEPSLRTSVDPLDTLRRLRRMVREHHGLVWRTVSRLGVPDDEVEDATQRVFIVVARKLGYIEPAQERSFVFSAALRIASEIRRSRRRRREDLQAEPNDQPDPRPSPEETLLRGELVDVLADLLEQLPEPQRAVLILHDLEEMTMADMSSVLGIPCGTVASRLRRARVAFRRMVEQFQDHSRAEEP